MLQIDMEYDNLYRIKGMKIRTGEGKMKNRKLNQLLVAGMISAAMMTSGISVQAADFSDDTSTVEEQSVGSAEEESSGGRGRILNFSLMLLKHHQQ